jgi:acetaldehyde dehydrogenase
MVGVKDSLGIATAAGMGLRTTTDGIDGFIRDCADIDLVFDCTSAAAHQVHAPLLQQQGIFTLDLTPAAVGPYVVPAVNLDESIFDLPNINLVTCAGQATTPIVAAINRGSGLLCGSFPRSAARVPARERAPISTSSP